MAFSLELTEGAIYDLLSMWAWEKDLASRGISDLDSYADRYSGRRSAAGYLCRRGLVAISDKTGAYLTTKAGRLACELLVEAGFKEPVVASVFPNNPVLPV